MQDLQNLDRAYVANTYNRFPIEILSGKGSVVTDAHGKNYIDMGSGIGVTSFGIADPEWIAAVSDQLSRVQHMSNLYYTEPCAALAEELCMRTGMKKVFFSNSGAEANECAIKVARKYAAEKKGSDCFYIITLENSFHGRTLTTLAATGQDVFHTTFMPFTEGFCHVPANDLDAMLAAMTDDVCAVMIEFVQGEGGVNVLDKEFVQATAALAKENDILLMIDEVQTGNGRTGEMYAYMNYGISPDVVTTAKGLGGGLPIGACLFSEKVENVLGHGDHGSTFGANPAACAGAVSIVERIDSELLAEVKEKSAYVFDRLSKAEGVKSVSGMGLMIGVECEKPVGEVLTACREKGVLALSAKTKLRLLPPLNIPMELLAEAIDVIMEALK